MKPGLGWWERFFAGLIGAGLVLGLPVVAIADSVSLSWDPNPEQDLAGYKVHIGTRPRRYTQAIDVGHATTFTVSGLFPGETYFIAVTAYDIFANESDHSAELIATIPEPPAPATVSAGPTAGEPAPEAVAKAEPLPGLALAPGPATVSAPPVSPEPVAPKPPPATQADPITPQSAGGGGAGEPGGPSGGTSASGDGSTSSPPLLASPLDSLRNVLGGDSGESKSPPAALAPPSEDLAAPSSGGGLGDSTTNPTNPINPTNPRSAGERAVQATGLHQQGRDLYAQGRVGDAIPRLQQAVGMWASLPVSEQAAVAAHDLGVAYYGAERHGDAIQAYQKALALYRQLEKRELQARVLDHLGRAYEGLGDHASADEGYRASIEIWEELGKRAEVAAVLEQLGASQAAAGRYEAALTSYQRSLDLFRELGDHERLKKLKDAVAQVERMAELSAAGTVGK